MVTPSSIAGNFGFQPCSHGDFLGAILGTGITREKLGDIIVQVSWYIFNIDMWQWSAWIVLALAIVIVGDMNDRHLLTVDSLYQYGCFN